METPPGVWAVQKVSRIYNYIDRCIGVCCVCVYLFQGCLSIIIDLIDYVHGIGNGKLTLYIRVCPHFFGAREGVDISGCAGTS